MKGKDNLSPGQWWWGNVTSVTETFGVRVREFSVPGGGKFEVTGSFQQLKGGVRKPSGDEKGALRDKT